MHYIVWLLPLIFYGIATDQHRVFACATLVWEDASELSTLHLFTIYMLQGCPNMYEICVHCWINQRKTYFVPNVEWISDIDMKHLNRMVKVNIANRFAYKRLSLIFKGQIEYWRWTSIDRYENAWRCNVDCGCPFLPSASNSGIRWLWCGALPWIITTRSWHL